MEPNNFLTQMMEILEAFDLQRLLAVAILKRETLLPFLNHVYLEKNFNTMEKSIVQVSLLCEAELHIRTSWTFDDSSSVGPKQTRCLSYCVWDGESHGGKEHTWG